ncbi:TonB-dependent receptor domain-containing protein [Methylocapsa palsarum]|uniref:TonB-dependent receptor domain-containing protein n=1 Tax=Methylocapsa palsarum TaxID=1612308 RepID=UPI000B839507
MLSGASNPPKETKRYRTDRALPKSDISCATHKLFEGKLRATADYYNLTKTNLPATDANPLHQCGGGPGSCSILIGEARSKGPELDIQGELLPGWSIILAYANQDVRVTKGSADQPTVGQRFPNIPQNLGSFWTTYEFQPDSELKGWKIGGGLIYHGSQPILSFPTNYLGAMTSGYATVSLMGAYSFKIGDVKLTAQVNVTNLLDATYYGETSVSSGSIPLPGYSSGLRPYGAPRAIMGSLSAQF